MAADSVDDYRKIADGYDFADPAIDLGVLLDDAGDPLPDVHIKLPLAMLNRHGLVSGATGTGKTVTLQLMAEQLSDFGVPVFAADVKGDLSGVAVPAERSEKVTQRANQTGQDWLPGASPAEFFSLGGQGDGIPLRATVEAFGPILMSKVLRLNDVQESALGLVFRYAEERKLPLLNLSDLTAVLRHVTTEKGKAQFKQLGSVSSTTIGVIQREITNLEDQGGSVFFGEPQFDSADLLATATDGRGIVNALELPNLQDRPTLFTTFLMWLLADLYQRLPEVGDLAKPKLVFFFDEAHLLFKGASKAFINQIIRTVGLVRSKGVGVFFFTQSARDVPSEVLAQLGSRVQHQLRVHSAADEKALQATVNTFGKSRYDLTQLLPSLQIGDAVVSVLDPDGKPTPVAWTRIFTPKSSLGALPPRQLQSIVAGSQLAARYGEAFDRYSAHEMLTGKGGRTLQQWRTNVPVDRWRGSEEITLNVKERAPLWLMGGGSLVGGIAMVVAQLQSPTNTMGQSIFTTIFTVLLVAGIWGMVLNVRNRLAQEGIARVPSTQPWRVAEIGAWFVAILMFLLAIFLVQVVINNPTGYFVGNLIATLGWGACSLGGGMLLRQMRTAFDSQWTPPAINPPDED